MNKKILGTNVVLIMTLASTTASANGDRTHRAKQAVKTIHDVDARGQAFTLSVAALGGGSAIGLGTWLLYENPLRSEGKPSALLFGNSLLMVSTGIGQFVHGFMRLGERQASATAARSLLDNPNTTEQEYLNYLRYRADQSVSTRFVGAVITTLQGVVGMLGGLELALTEKSEYKTSGWILSGLGLLSTGVGAIHFFGKTRAQRELDQALEKKSTTSSLSFDLSPTVLLSENGKASAGILVSGRF